jgi:hypothetical protein
VLQEQGIVFPYPRRDVRIIRPGPESAPVA